MKVVYSWLKEYVGEHLPPPNELEELLTFHAFEVESVEDRDGETVLDIKILPDRGSDCLCHRGIAREIASILRTPLTHDPLAQVPFLPETHSIKVAIEDEAACPRFMAAHITGVSVTESPTWLQTRLRAIGQRPINNIVDATNYVMYAIGQPLHAYDADLFPCVDGQWQFAVRMARVGETVSLIPEGGKDGDRIITCEGTELLIVDASSDTPIGLAGVKGGRYAGVHNGTTSIIIEAAHFHPTITRRTARRLGIVIDASKRFENEPSRELPPYALREVVDLITHIAGGSQQGVVDAYISRQPTPTVRVRRATVNSLLGLDLSGQEICAILRAIGATVEEPVADEYDVTGPWERTDLKIEEDFIEEIGRLHGYDAVRAVLPAKEPVHIFNYRQYYTELIRECLVQRGFSEVITSSFTSHDSIQLQNALASDKSFLRSTLKKNLTHVLDHNSTHADLLGLRLIQVFEIGTVFGKNDGCIDEYTAIALGVRSKGDGYSAKDDAPLASACEAINDVLGVTLSWNITQGVAEANLSLVLPSLPPPVGYKPVESRGDIIYRPVSPHPSITRDVAVWVPVHTSAAEVERVIKELSGSLCVRLSLFDTFTKAERTSYAFRIVFQSPERTLTNDEIDIIMTSVYAGLGAQGFEVR